MVPKENNTFVLFVEARKVELCPIEEE